MIIPSSQYPAQVDVSDLTNYPQGKARNVVGTGDTTGTPFEKTWINDLWGWMQALVAHAGITPSGSPDTAVASDLMNAVCAARAIAVYAITAGVDKTIGQLFSLTQTSQFGGFSVASDLITVPAIGKYRVTISGYAKSNDSTNPISVWVTLNVGATALDVLSTRYAATTSLPVPLKEDYVFSITDPSTQKIKVVANGVGGAMQFVSSPGSPQLTVERVG